MIQNLQKINFHTFNYFDGLLYLKYIKTAVTNVDIVSSNSKVCLVIISIFYIN